MIEAHNLCATLGAFALGPIDLRVDAGAHNLIIGPSGAGKSLLLRVLAGLHPGQRGQRTIPSGCAWVGQTPALFPHMRVRDNVAFGLRCQGVSPAVRRASVQRWAERLRITALLERLPAQLSAGEQQRVALARALAPGFHALLLDEPFSALDRGARVDLYALLEALRATMPLSIVHVTHDIDIFAQSSLPALAMVAGTVVQTGTVRSILASPQHPALRVALGTLQSSKRFAALK